MSILKFAFNKVLLRLGNPTATINFSHKLDRTECCNRVS